MLGKILIVVGILLIVGSVGLVVSAMPIFTFTRTTTQTVNLPPIQKSESIMNYSFYPTIYSGTKIPFQCTTVQTLSISMTCSTEFDFDIASQQPNGIEAFYYSKENTRSVSLEWTPTQDGSYYLKVYEQWAPIQPVYTVVTKTWTEAQTRTDTITVTEQKPLINLDMTQINYLGSGLVVLGAVITVIGMYSHYKIPPKKNKELAQPPRP
jgi:hypothetical protein